jgi:transposase
MVNKGQQYINPEGYLFLDQKRKQGLVKRIKKQIAKFELTNEELGFVTD